MIWALRAAMQRLLDEPDLLPRLRAGVRPPMTMEEHVDRLVALHAVIVQNSAKGGKRGLSPCCSCFSSPIPQASRRANGAPPWCR